VQTAYTLTFGGLLLLGARAGDILGRRRMCTAGVALFALASLLVACAQSAGWLVAARALQGVGAAVLAPSTLALLQSRLLEVELAQDAQHGLVGELSLAAHLQQCVALGGEHGLQQSARYARGGDGEWATGAGESDHAPAGGTGATTRVGLPRPWRQRDSRHGDLFVLLDQFGERHLEAAFEFEQGAEGRVDLAAFDRADVVAVKVGAGAECFLGEAACGAHDPYGAGLAEQKDRAVLPRALR